MCVGKKTSFSNDGIGRHSFRNIRGGIGGWRGIPNTKVQDKWSNTKISVGGKRVEGGGFSDPICNHSI